jgi:hypothetical protein
VQLVRLADWLHFNCPVTLESPETAPAISIPTVLLVWANQRWVGLQIERSWGEQEVALRRVVGNLPMPQGFNSCTNPVDCFKSLQIHGGRGIFRCFRYTALELSTVLADTLLSLHQIEPILFAALTYFQ